MINNPEEPSAPPPGGSPDQSRSLQITYGAAGLGALGVTLWTASASLWAWAAVALVASGMILLASVVHARTDDPARRFTDILAAIFNRPTQRP